MKLSFNIRLAKEQDLAILQVIEKKASALFAKTKHYAAVSKYVTSLDDFKLARAAGHLFVAINDADIPIGFVLIEKMKHGAHLHEIDVLPEYGRKGVGTALVKKVCEWAMENKHPAVTLTTYKDIPWNAPFYRSLGFYDLSINELPDQLYKLFLRENEIGLLMEERVVMYKMIFEVTNE